MAGATGTMLSGSPRPVPAPLAGAGDRAQDGRGPARPRSWRDLPQIGPQAQGGRS